MTAKKLLLAVFLLITISGYTQLNRYVVQFKNKGGTPFSISNPSAYLSQRALERRTRYNIAIDSTDLPCSPIYINQVISFPGVTLHNVSKWLNAISIHCADAGSISAITSLPFVQSVTAVALRPATETPAEKYGEPADPEPNYLRITADYFDYGPGSYNEIHLHNGEFLHNIGLRGQNMHIAMLDAGFFNYTSLKAFDSVNINGQILSTWDFVARHGSVVEDNSHGMQCLSTIAANIPGQFIGKAPKASFHLFRTEDVASEYRIEEFNWVCGAERADSAGANIISSSVGYAIQMTDPSMNHPYSDMDGNTTMAAIGGDLAAKKGLMVFASIGNDGTRSDYNKLSTPSDGDSVVAVGAVNIAGTVGAFSSYGPSADGQVKPDIASVGVAAMIQFNNNTIGNSNGTSWACPNMAGLSGCLWQGFPEFNNMRIVHALKQSADRFQNPDNRTGYGIPDMKKAFGILLAEFATSQSSLNGCEVSVQWTTKSTSTMRFEIERKGPGDISFVKVAELPAANDGILAIKTYQHVLGLPAGSTGQFAFRIRQIIDTAAAGFASVYIDTTTVNIVSPCVSLSTDRDITVRPNPSNGSNSMLIVRSDQPIDILNVLVYDASGRRVMHKKFSMGAGTAVFSLPMSNFAAGKYFINVYDNNKKLGSAELMKL